MAKKTVALMPGTQQVLEKMGANIKKARLRRNISVEYLVEHVLISADTITAIEKGASTVSIGAYAAVLFALGLDKDFELIARDEEGKKKYQRTVWPDRKRATKRKGQ